MSAAEIPKPQPLKRPFASERPSTMSDYDVASNWPAAVRSRHDSYRHRVDDGYATSRSLRGYFTKVAALDWNIKQDNPFFLDDITAAYSRAVADHITVAYDMLPAVGEVESLVGSAIVGLQATNGSDNSKSLLSSRAALLPLKALEGLVQSSFAADQLEPWYLATVEAAMQYIDSDHGATCIKPGCDEDLDDLMCIESTNCPIRDIRAILLRSVRQPESNILSDIDYKQMQSVGEAALHVTIGMGLTSIEDELPYVGWMYDRAIASS